MSRVRKVYLGSAPVAVSARGEKKQGDNRPREGKIKCSMRHDPYRSIEDKRESEREMATTKNETE